MFGRFIAATARASRSKRSENCSREASIATRDLQTPALFVRRTTSAVAAPAAFATSCKPRRPTGTYGCTSCPKEVYNPRNLKEAGMKRVTVLGALLVIGGVSAVIVAQQPPRPPLPDLTKVKDNLYVITSSTPGPEFTGGNTGVLVTESGVVV